MAAKPGDAVAQKICNRIIAFATLGAIAVNVILRLDPMLKSFYAVKTVASI